MEYDNDISHLQLELPREPEARPSRREHTGNTVTPGTGAQWCTTRSVFQHLSPARERTASWSLLEAPASDICHRGGTYPLSLVSVSCSAYFCLGSCTWILPAWTLKFWVPAGTVAFGAEAVPEMMQQRPLVVDPSTAPWGRRTCSSQAAAWSSILSPPKVTSSKGHLQKLCS